MTNLLAQKVQTHENNPVFMYLATLSPGSSRRSVAGRLGFLARTLRPGTNALTCPWAEITVGEIVALREKLQSRLRPATVNTGLALLRGVFRAAWRMGQMSTEQFMRLRDVRCVRGDRIARGRAASLSELGELMRVVRASKKRWLSARDAVMLVILYAGGLRRAELVGLNIGDVTQDESGRISLKVRGKRNRERRVWLASSFAPEIERWMKVRGEAPGALLPRVSKAAEIAPLTGGAVTLRLRMLVSRAGLEPLRPHDMRRTFISELLDAGVDLLAVQRQAGHLSPATTALYDRRDERAKMKAADALPCPF